MIRLIPANLDIDKHIKVNPPTTIKDFRIEHLLYLIDIISSVPATYKGMTMINGFTQLDSQELRRKCTNYKQYLDYLINTKVIKSDNHYIKTRKCKGYKLADEYSGILVEVAVEKRKSGRPKKIALKGNEINTVHLSKWYNEGLTIDGVLARQFIKTELERKKRFPLLKEVRENKYWENGINYKDEEKQYNYALHSIVKIEEALFNVHRDSNVKRLHSAITSLPTSLRNTLTYENKQLVSVDIKNSQPYIANILLTREFWTEENESRKNLRMKEIINSIRNKDGIIMYQYSDSSTTPEDVALFRECTSYGTFYETVAEKFQEIGLLTDASRDSFKKVILKTLYSSNRYSDIYKKTFMHLFPEVDRIFRLVKENDKSILPVLLQVIESDIVLDIIAKRITEEKPELFFITIHDSIITVDGCEAYIKRLIEEEMASIIGFAPTVEIEQLTVDKMRFNDSLLYKDYCSIAA
jgi:hypothetical protein